MHQSPIHSSSRPFLRPMNPARGWKQRRRQSASVHTVWIWPLTAPIRGLVRRATDRFLANP